MVTPLSKGNDISMKKNVDDVLKSSPEPLGQYELNLVKEDSSLFKFRTLPFHKR